MTLFLIGRHVCFADCPRRKGGFLGNPFYGGFKVYVDGATRGKLGPVRIGGILRNDVGRSCLCPLKL